MVLLISPHKLIQSSIIDENVDQKVLSKNIHQVQETQVRDVLGESLYNSLINALDENITNGTAILPIYTQLLNKIKPFLIACVQSEFIFLNQYRLSNKGILKMTDENSQNLGTDEIDKLRQYFVSTSQQYKRDLIKFLEKNKLVEGVETDKNTTTKSLGWYFPKTGYEKISSNLDSVEEAFEDRYITGATFSSGILYLYGTNGDVLEVSFGSGFNDTFVSGGTFSSNVLTLRKNDNTNVTIPFTGLSYNDTYVTGATYSNGSIVFTNNTGGTFNVNGLFTGQTEVFITGGTYNSNTGVATFTNNTGGTFNVSGFYTSNQDIDVTGGTYNNGVITFTNKTGGTFTVSGFFTGSTEVFVTGGTYNSGSSSIQFTNNTGGTFQVTGITVGGGSTNLYNSDGTLTGNRVVNLSSSSITFTSTTSSGSLQTVLSNSINGFRVNTASGQSWGISGSSSELYRVTNNGNLLVGTSVDNGFKLDVNGTSAYRNTVRVIGTAGYGSNIFEFTLNGGSTVAGNINGFGIWNITNGGTNTTAANIGSITSLGQNTTSLMISSQLNSFAITQWNGVYGTSNHSSTSGPFIVVPNGSVGSFNQLSIGGSQTSGVLTSNSLVALRHWVNNGVYVVGNTTGAQTYTLLETPIMIQCNQPNKVIRGFVYNPSITATTALAGNYAFVAATGNVGIGTLSPNNNASLELSGSSSGFLPNRLTASQAAALGWGASEEGMMIYVSSTSATTFTVKGWYGWNGTGWERLNN